MASAGRRKRRVQVDESLITDVRDHSKRLPQNRDMEVDFSFVPYTYNPANLTVSGSERLQYCADGT